MIEQENNNNNNNVSLDEGGQKCACKGIRFCALCKNSPRVLKLKLEDNYTHADYDRYIYSSKFNRAINDPHLPRQPSLEDIHEASERVEMMTNQPDENNSLTIGGLLLIDNFLSEQEELDIVDRIDKTEWMISQSGRRKQDYGPRVNFKGKKVKWDRFIGMPDYADLILNRMKEKSAAKLSEYQPFELCNLEYLDERLSAIEMHFDDSWIWGNRLISINLLNNCVMTFTNDEKRIVVYAALKRGTLVCMADEIRYQWKHGVLSEHIRGRRIALTMREASPLFKEGGELYEKFGKDLIRISNQRIKC